MRCWYAVLSSKSSSYRIRVTRHSWPSPWRYGGLQPLLHLAMSPHGTDGPSPIQKAAAGIGIRGSRLILVARNGRSRRLDSADRFPGLAPEFSGVEALRAGLRDLGYIDGAAGEHSNCKWLHDTL